MIIILPEHTIWWYLIWTVGQKFYLVIRDCAQGPQISELSAKPFKSNLTFDQLASVLFHGEKGSSLQTKLALYKPPTAFKTEDKCIRVAQTQIWNTYFFMVLSARISFRIVCFIIKELKFCNSIAFFYQACLKSFSLSHGSELLLPPHTLRFFFNFSFFIFEWPWRTPHLRLHMEVLANLSLFYLFWKSHQSHRFW